MKLNKLRDSSGNDLIECSKNDFFNAARCVTFRVCRISHTYMPVYDIGGHFASRSGSIRVTSLLVEYVFILID